MNKIDIRQEHCLPQTFRLFGFGVIIGGLTFILPIPANDAQSLINLSIGIGLILIGLLMATTRYGLKINFTDPSYTVYIWYLGVKSGKPVKFNRIEKFYIKAVTETTSISNFYGAKRDYNKQVFKAYMLLDNEEKIHVDTHKNEDKLIEKVKHYKKIAMPVLNSH